MSMSNSQQDALAASKQRLLLKSLKEGPYVFREIPDPSNKGKIKVQKEEDLSDKELAKYEADIKLKNILIKYGVYSKLILEKMEASKAEHAGVTKALGDDSQLNEAFLNKEHYETKYDLDSDEDRLIHGSTSIFCLMAHIDKSSLDPTCDNSQVHHDLVDLDHLAMLQSYTLLQSQLKDFSIHIQVEKMDLTLKVIQVKQEFCVAGLINTSASEMEILSAVKKLLKKNIEHHMNKVYDKFLSFEEEMLSEMQDELTYATSLENEFH
ncbi:hypothetical protein Tco_0218841 [Tanacetum coccineum]